MANDRRPFAFIDTGYFTNPKWFDVEQYFRTHTDSNTDSNTDRITTSMTTRITDPNTLVRDAREAHLCSILYSVRNFTDGLFPVPYVMREATVENPAIIDALYAAGMWIDKGNGMALVHDFLEHQASADDRRQKSEQGRKAVEARWAKKRARQTKKHTDSNTDRNTERITERITDSNTGSNTEESRGEKSISNPATTDADAFDAFWDNYPKKVSKDQARKAYEKRIKQGISPSVLASKALEYATLMEHEQRDKKFIKNPATWLNAAAYEDDMAIPQEKISHEQWKMNNLPKVDLNEWL